MDKNKVAKELVKLAKALVAGEYYRLEKEGLHTLYILANSYDLKDFYKSVAAGNDFPMREIDQLIAHLEAVKKLAIKSS